ncbi:MAG: DUF2062 domain-containing protein [bacterium]|nr:DUF2062 domain-containing protein [bacterium]
MLFKRKKKLTFIQKIRNFLFPKKGLIRAYKYLLKRLFRLKGNIHSVSLGAAFGVSIAITPLFGLQLILTIIFDIIFKANITASMLFTVIGNPLTFPFIWFADYKLGNLILSNETMDSSSFSKIIDEIIIAFKASNWEVIGSYVASILYPMFVGGIIIAIIIGIITYKFVFKSLVEYKEIKSRKILKEAK